MQKNENICSKSIEHWTLRTVTVYHEFSFSSVSMQIRVRFASNPFLQESNKVDKMMAKNSALYRIEYRCFQMVRGGGQED